MKSNLLFLLTILSFFSFSAFSQLKVNSNGKIIIGTDLGYNYSLQVSGATGNSGIFADATLNTTFGSFYGVYGRINNPTLGAISRGVYGYVYSATAAQAGQAYGVVGTAGNCTDGYNYGVFGNLLGTKSGAAVLGMTGTFTPPSDLTLANVQYAGYFVGNVKMTGSIWAASGTITGSDERIKKEISVLDASENLYKLLPKQYKLKTPAELFSEPKTTSDTANTVNASNTATAEKSIQTSNKDYDKLHYGFLAQELQLVYPDLVYTSPDGTLGIDYQGLIPMIIDQLQK